MVYFGFGENLNESYWGGADLNWLEKGCQLLQNIII